MRHEPCSLFRKSSFNPYGHHKHGQFKTAWIYDVQVFQGKGALVFTSSWKSKTVLLQHRFWSPRLCSKSLQGNTFSRIFEHRGTCALPLTSLPLLPSLSPSGSSVFSPSGLCFSSMYHFSPCSPNLSRRFFTLSFLYPLKKTHALYLFSGFEEQKFGLDACVIT